MKDYYRILCVKPTATESEIKSSYRVLAKKYHPDVNPDDSTAAAKFADINEANSILSDPKARAEYDAKLKESNAGMNRDDIIARQRAAAQAAARQAAYRQSMNNMSGAGSSARRDATIARARAAAQAQAQAAAQAQMQAVVNQAYQKGVAEARAAAQAERAKAAANLKAALAENKRLKARLEEEAENKRKLTLAEQDRRELEQELFNRDREISQEKTRIKELEERVAELQETGNVSNRVKAENAKLKDSLAQAKQEARKQETELKKQESEKAELGKEIEKLRAELEQQYEHIKQAEQEKKQAELKSAAQLQLQQEKRHKLQEEVDELNRKLAAASAEAEALRAENERWQQYAESEDFLSDADRRIQEWTKKSHADKRLAKNTLYAELGLLIWATDEEIEQAYAKLYKKLNGKEGEEFVNKLAKIEQAYAVLRDPTTRAEYNGTIGITQERIEEERKLRAANESLIEEYNDRLASKEFWAKFDDLTVSALSGDAEAQNTLGNMYYSGEEIDRDVDQAAFWFKEAAKQKHANAMCSLGVCFLNGEGVEKNENTGLGFIRQAAKLGSKTATKLLKEKTKEQQ